MNIARSPEMQLDIETGFRAGEIAVYHALDPAYAARQKADDTPVGPGDEAAEAEIVLSYTARGIPVVSEEGGGTAKYGARNAIYTDPTDGTKNLDDAIKAWREKPRPGQVSPLSIAGVSIGAVLEGEYRRGVAVMPFLTSPPKQILYWSEGNGSYRIDGQNGPESALEPPDPRLTHGVILVSNNHHPYIDALENHGFKVVGVDGAVWKALCVADPRLAQNHFDNLDLGGQQVIGFVSTSAKTHDCAGAVPIVEGLGGVGGGLDGNKIGLSKKHRGCIFANNPKTFRMLVDIMNAGGFARK